MVGYVGNARISFCAKDFLSGVSATAVIRAR